ncbi:hypothetical protein ACFL43_00440 [Thermodesulfobacteriota bacterium]
MYEGSTVKFKGENPEYWDLDPDKIYHVQDSEYKGDQRVIKLRNKKGKLRRYYKHLFEEVKISEPEHRDQELKNECERLKKIWLKDNSQESKDAFQKLKDLGTHWLGSLPFAKGVKVRFIKEKEAGRFEGRVFKCKTNMSEHGFFDAKVRLTGLYGTYSVNDLEAVEE